MNQLNHVARIPSVRQVFMVSVGLLANVSNVAAETLTFTSGERKNQLVELYTSEGCSSCPPADRWLSALKSQPDLWHNVVPVAFHVDYWDRLGWKDRFANRDYSFRQRSYARAYDEPTVYTPGVRRNGEEWRSWRRQSEIKPQASAQRVGELQISISKQNEVTASFQPIAGSRDSSYRLNLVLLGMNLVTEVERGENHGRTLNHDFVVLAKTSDSKAKTRVDEKGRTIFTWSSNLPESELVAPDYAFAAWVTSAGSHSASSVSYLAPIQTTGGFLPDYIP